MSDFRYPDGRLSENYTTRPRRTWAQTQIEDSRQRGETYNALTQEYRDLRDRGIDEYHRSGRMQPYMYPMDSYFELRNQARRPGYSSPSAYPHDPDLLPGPRD